MRRRLPASLALLLALVTPSTHPQDAKPPHPKLSSAADHWVEHTLKHMTTDEKVGQIVFPTYFGAFYSTESDDYQELMKRVEHDHIGGFILATRAGPKGIERGTVYATATLANQLQRKSKIPLLIAADFEHGTVMRIIEGTSFPEPMAVAAGGRPEDAYAAGRITALEAGAVGVHWVLAPVADVNSNPDNPIINIRSFGEDPQRVASFVAAFVRGVEDNGALSTAKHFPGHGDTGTDSHLDLPLLKSDRAHLDAVELVPFRAALASGVSSVMTAHLTVPALEPDREVPATLSEKVLTDLLRKEMAFDGLIVPDALDMGGVTNHYAPAEVAVRAFNAGADVLLQPPVPDAALLAMKEAVKSGRVPMSRLDDAVRRVLRAKARLGLEKQRLVNVDRLNSVYGRPEFARTAQDIADRGVTLLRDDAKLLPIDARKRLRTLLVSISADPDTTPGYDFAQALRTELDTVDSVRVDSRYLRPDTVTIPPPANYDLVIISLTVRVADRKGTVGLPADQAALVHRLLASGKPTVVASFGSPYLFEGFPEAKTWLAVFDTNDVGQRAGARAALGEAAITGKLPVRLPGAQPHALAVGDGLTTSADPMTLRPASPDMVSRLKPAHEILERAAADGIRGTLLVTHAGFFSIHHDGVEPSGKTLPPVDDFFPGPYAATVAAMLATEKQLTMDTPIFRIIPEWLSGPDSERRRRVTVRHLLENTSGLPSESESKSGFPRQAPLEQAFTGPLVAEPGSTFNHSPMNLFLFAEVVRRLTGQGFLEFGEQRVFPYLKQANSALSPLDAKLTSGVLALGQVWLDGGIYAHRRFFRRALSTQMTSSPGREGSAFGYGWDKPSEALGTGKYFSSQAYGSGGDPLRSLWIDPEKDLVVVIFLSSPDPRPDLGKLASIRAALHDAVIEGLGIAPLH